MPPRGLWIVAYAITLHLTWGVLLLISDAPARVTAVHVLAMLLGPQLLAVALLGVGLAAWLAVARDRAGHLEFFLILPQQVTLMLSAGGAVLAMWTGHFADGEPRPHAFILADQAPAVLAALLHTGAILGWFRRGR
jgi:hypothetical protein